MSKNPLGESTAYPLQYEPDILHQIPRLPARLLLDIDKKIKMYGFDHWHAYEISWLDSNRKPNVGIGEFFFSAESKNIIESKSLKLYLNSLNNEIFLGVSDVQQRIRDDLSKISHSEVKVFITSVSESEPGELVKAISPKFNRAVLFDTTQNSWHGLRGPVTSPDGENRKSLAVYYLCEPEENTSDRGKALFSPSEDQKNDPDVLNLIKLRSGIDTASSVWKKKK